MLWAKCLGTQRSRTSLVGCWHIHTSAIGMKSCPHPTSQWAVEELPCFVREMTTSIPPLPSRDLSGAGKHPCVPLRLMGSRAPANVEQSGACPYACLWLTAASTFTQHTRNTNVCENFLLCKTGSRNYCFVQAMQLWSLVLSSVQTLSFWKRSQPIQNIVTSGQRWKVK